MEDKYREVLEYLVQATERDPNAYCFAAGGINLYHVKHGVPGVTRTGGTFHFATLAAMERRGWVVRSTRHESMISGPRTKFTVAKITDAGRAALKEATSELSPGALAAVPEIVKWLWSQAGQLRGTQAKDGVGMAASLLEHAAGISSWDEGK